jgi:hypothetical protein
MCVFSTNVFTSIMYAIAYVSNSFIPFYYWVITQHMDMANCVYSFIIDGFGLLASFGYYQTYFVNIHVHVFMNGYVFTSLGHI